MTKIIHEATKVKNAALMHNEKTDIFELQHYDTIILTIAFSKVVDIKPVSQSSIRAINQVLKYLGFTENHKFYAKHLRELGHNIPKMGEY